MDLCRQTACDARVDLWHFDLAAGFGRSEAAEAALDTIERDRMRRFVSDRDRARFAAARARLRCILGRYVGADGADLVIDYGESGKPYLPRHPRLGFNLAHSGERAVLAVLRGSRVGVDIEALDRARRHDAIARRFFAPEENAWLFAQGVRAASEHCERFYRIWTCREAFGKALGSGLALAADAYALGFDDEGCARVLRTAVAGESARAWRFETRRIDGFVVSVCAELD